MDPKLKDTLSAALAGELKAQDVLAKCTQQRQAAEKAIYDAIKDDEAAKAKIAEILAEFHAPKK